MQLNNLTPEDEEQLANAIAKGIQKAEEDDNMDIAQMLVFAVLVIIGICLFPWAYLLCIFHPILGPATILFAIWCCIKMLRAMFRKR